MKRLLADWGLTGAALVADTPRARVWRVMQGDRAAALKVLKPGADDEARGMAVLAWYQGSGAARVLAARDGALLMEWVGGPSLGDLARGGDDAGAMGILCDVVAALHRDRPAPPVGLEPLANRFAPLFDSAPIGDSARAARLAEALLASTTTPVVLHGDLHHDNILQADIPQVGRGWLAIDPKGVWGDPAYEPSNAFRNPEGAEALALDPARIAALGAVIAGRLGFALPRVLGWAAAHVALSLCWHRAAGTPVAFDTALLPRLLDAHARCA